MVRFGVILRRWDIRNYRVSIPVWCDLENTVKELDLKSIYVSIPVWCDLEMGKRYHFGRWRLFQFQYGAIWSGVGIEINKDYL